MRKLSVFQTIVTQTPCLSLKWLQPDIYAFEAGDISWGMKTQAQKRSKRLGLEPLIHDSAQIVDCQFGKYVEVGRECQLLESEFGDYSYICRYGDVAYASIGKFVNIASFVRIGPTNHPMWRASQHHFMYRSEQYGFGENERLIFDWRREQRVAVGHDVWLGHSVTVMPGISVGHGAVAASAAVVTRDVPPYSVVGGVPARRIKDRFPERIQVRLMDLAWWNWDHERIGDALDDFRTLNIEEFLEKHE